MFNLLHKAATALKLYVLRRRQFDSVALRRHFSRHYGIEVGLYSYGCFDRWRMPGPLTVGRYCSIAATVRSTNNNHPLTALTTHPALYEKKFGLVDHDHAWDGFLVIEDDVWIGHNAVILPGCRTIGRGAVIGAGAIVTHDVPRYAVMAGNPARKLRDRFAPDLAEAIEASRWWEMDMAGLRALRQTNPSLIFEPAEDLVSNISDDPSKAFVDGCFDRRHPPPNSQSLDRPHATRSDVETIDAHRSGPSLQVGADP